MTTPAAVSLSAAFVAGVAGGAHCFAMCGGIAGALGMRARMHARGAAVAFLNAVAYHIARVGGYAAAGVIFGFAGAGLQSMFNLMRIGAVLRIASGALLILLGVRILLQWNALAVVERLGARVWLTIQPLAQRAARSESPGRALLLGFLWGWLPCGLVYSMLMFAATSGDALHGAAIMAAFGLGTLPSMLTSSLIASQLQRTLARRWPRLVSGALLLLFGAWMMATPLVHRL